MQYLNGELEGMRVESYLSMYYVNSAYIKIGMAYFKVIFPYSLASSDRNHRKLQ
jgi:hypothetical protein